MIQAFDPQDLAVSATESWFPLTRPFLSHRTFLLKQRLSQNQLPACCEAFGKEARVRAKLLSWWAPGLWVCFTRCCCSCTVAVC
jgi:hypothetical protein